MFVSLFPRCDALVLSLARQWTVEDEEEVERERRRKVKSTSCDGDGDFSPTTGDVSPRDSAFGTDSTSETSQGLSSMDQIQLDFVEMLRVRDERRRMRHVETLRQQKEEGEACTGGGRVELLGDLEEHQASVLPSVKAPPRPPAPQNTSSYTRSNSSGSKTSTHTTNKQPENGESTSKHPDPKPPSNPARKFVSSVSISFDKSPSASGCTSPMSPRSPTAPREHRPSPCQTPSPGRPQSPDHSGHMGETRMNGSSSDGSFEQTAKPALVRQSSRTISFRMMRKKEEESAPLQRSASVRTAYKMSESNTDQNEDEDKSSSFQRNSKQRISSRSIKEKMERLAQAAQKSDITRSPDVTQRTLFLLDEVSRKRGLFEKEQQAASPTSPGVSRQEFRSFRSGMSDRINRWLNKTNETGSTHNPTDLRHVDIISKRSLFESKDEGSVPNNSRGKI
uniref:ladinin-1 isoform X1 n=1 Tax=Gasterosteus aculeatus aculeatus TaxID=481459 RepID=UPI001A98933C|nr:ladinin-1 isoform X1 [Gasterosteus aculeatus aculeatus]